MLKRFLNVLLGVSVSSVCLGIGGTGCNHSYVNEYENSEIGIMPSYLLNECSSEGAHLNSYNDFRTFYFDNLTTNFGMNYKGSCGYVAIGMLLSYYDTVLSDNIIPEQYDVNSVGTGKNLIIRRNNPGIYHDIMKNGSKTGSDYTNKEYLSTINSQVGYSLHAKLIKMGEEKGYINFNTSYHSPCGSSYEQRIEVMREYFTNELHYTENVDYRFDGINGVSDPTMSGQVRNFTINQVQNGNPVLLAVGGPSGGHAIVAYAYDSNTDRLFCHMGWTAGTTHEIVEDFGFNTYRSAVAIIFNIAHSESNNYVFVDTNNNRTYYSVDEITEDYTLGHEHSYCDHYARYSKTQHKAYCACGDYVLRPHSVKVGSTTIGRGIMRAVCEDCGALIDLGTTPVIAYQ